MALEGQLQLVRYVQTDATYDDLCDDQDNWSLALGGDSHGSRLGSAMRGLIGQGRFDGGVWLNRGFNFCQGGMQAMRYQRDQRFDRLRSCSARIILLALGGNDLDQRYRRDRRDVIHDLLLLIVDLERRGKIVYVIGIPWRHSSRRQNGDVMRSKISYINRKLKQIIHHRLIALPSRCYPRRSFERSFFRPDNGPIREEYVHLLPEMYICAARHILSRLNQDLRGRHSPPSRNIFTVNHFFDTH